MKRITDREASLVVAMLRERMNELSEMASGNWASPTEEEAREMYAERDRLKRLATRLDPPEPGDWEYRPLWGANSPRWQYPEGRYHYWNGTQYVWDGVQYVWDDAASRWVAS